MSAQDPLYNSTLPLPVPKYAINIKGAGVRPVRYYRNATDAKTYLVAHIRAELDPVTHMSLTGTYVFSSEVQIYKYDPENHNFRIIFDSRSPLAHLFMSGALTEGQMMARIFDEA